MKIQTLNDFLGGGLIIVAICICIALYHYNTSGGDAVLGYSVALIICIIGVLMFFANACKNNDDCPTNQTCTGKKSGWTTLSFGKNTCAKSTVPEGNGKCCPENACGDKQTQDSCDGSTSGDGKTTCNWEASGSCNNSPADSGKCVPGNPSMGEKWNKICGANKNPGKCHAPCKWNSPG